MCCAPLNPSDLSHGSMRSRTSQLLTWLAPWAVTAWSTRPAAPYGDPGRAQGTRLESRLNPVPYGPDDNLGDSRLLHPLAGAFTHDDTSLKADVSVRWRRTLIIIFQPLQAEDVRK